MTKARLTQQGQEDRQQILGMRLVRRLYDYGHSGGTRVKRLIQASWQTITQAVGFQVSEQEVLTEPLVASEHLRDYLQERGQRAKAQQLKAWQRSLSDRGRPTGKLHRWLRGEQAVVSPTLIIDNQPCTDLKDVLAHHRHFWEDIGTRQELQQGTPLDMLVGLGQSEAIIGQQVLQAAKLLQGKAVSGLDRWSVQAICAMDLELATCLAHLFTYTEATGYWPSGASAVRVAFLPKDPAKATQLSGWRPIAVTSVLYRLYGKIRLPEVMRAIQPTLHEGVIGGLPSDASGQVLRIATYAEAFARGAGDRLLGVSLDASKCFDRIDWMQVAKLACEQGVSHGVVRAILSYYLVHKRYASLGGRMDGQAWQLSRGLLQGCSLSVAFTLSLVSHWHHSLGANIRSISFIDDRIMLAQSSEHLEEAWEISMQWDRSHGWAVNVCKTVGFAVGGAPPQLEADGECISQPLVFKYLGSEIHLACHQSRVVLKQRLCTAFATLKRIGQLPASIGINGLLRTVETTAMPQLLYGFQTREIPQMILKQVAAAVRKAVWRGGKRMHSWPAVVLSCYAYHRVHPHAAALYTHILSIFRGLRALDLDNLRDLKHVFEAPPCPRSRGPIQVFCSQMSRLGIEKGREWDEWIFPERTVHLLTIPAKEFAHLVRNALRAHGKNILVRQRRCYHDVHTDGCELQQRLSTGQEAKASPVR